MRARVGVGVRARVGVWLRARVEVGVRVWFGLAGWSEGGRAPQRARTKVRAPEG